MMTIQASQRDRRLAWRTFRRFARLGASPSRRRARLISVIANFRANRSGASAIEFALVAGPFILLLFGILELALIFIVNTGLNVATATLAKQIRTGQVQAPGLASTTSSGAQLNLSDAVNQLCSQIQIMSLPTCVKQLQLDVRPISSFQNTAGGSPVSGSSFNAASLCYYSGNGGDIVEMRAYYLYSFFNPILLAALSNISSYSSGGASSSGKYFLIQTIQVFKTENFSGSSNTGAGC